MFLEFTLRLFLLFWNVLFLAFFFVFSFLSVRGQVHFTYTRIHKDSHNSFLCSTALSEALKEEVQRLRIAAGQVASINGNLFNRPPQYPSSRPPVHHFSSSHAQQGQQQQPPSMLATNQQQQSDPKWTNSSQLLSRSPDGQAKPQKMSVHIIYYLANEGNGFYNHFLVHFSYIYISCMHEKYVLCQLLRMLYQ